MGGAVILAALSRLPAGAGPWLAGVVAVVGGTFLVGWNGLAVALIVERAGAARAATAPGVALTVLFLGTIRGTPFFGWVVERSGAYAPAWLFVAASQVAACAFLRTARERVSPSG
ncbi:MAG: hypothetical protein QN187_01145 [Armatimonadota bacterium]|nr:hypothetical protein [Armatimonadota bacterium]